eukprot:scaffold7326_cov249-Pinguiococcus_pyrenoidosus.AAC.10
MRSSRAEVIGVRSPSHEACSLTAWHEVGGKESLSLMGAEDKGRLVQNLLLTESQQASKQASKQRFGS